MIDGTEGRDGAEARDGTEGRNGTEGRDRAEAGDGAEAGDALTVGARVKAILVASVGNLIEWFDVYAFSAFSLYFGKSFFADVDPVVVQRDAAIVFALGFVVRPLGSVLFGYLADRFGRRQALLTSILCMCAGSLLIAVAPTSRMIGGAAPLVLLAARIIQGISQGGEYGASVTYLAEMSDPRRRGFYSGVWYTTLIGGQLLALVLLLVLQKLILTEAQLYAWGWRIPFVLGAGLALVALLLRRDMAETAHFAAAAHARRSMARSRGPLRELIRHWKTLLVVVGFTVGGTSAFYTFTTYMQKFLKLTLGLPSDTVTLVTAGSLLVAVILQPLYGALSDRIGRRPMLIAFGVLGTLGTYPILTTLEHTRSAWVAWLLIVAGWAIVSGYTSITAVVKAELFPTSIRALGVGVPYALTVAVFGGTIDSVALQFKTSGHVSYFYWYVTGLIAISLLVYLGLRDTKVHTRMEQHY